MAALAERKDPAAASHFYVEIEGIIQAGFTECSGLQAQTEVMEVKEGGENGYVHKLPGRTTFGNITLKWGMTESLALWNWYKQTLQGKVTRKNLSIVLFSSQGDELRRWNLQEAFPVKWIGPTFDATKLEVSIETLELAHHGFVTE